MEPMTPEDFVAWRKRLRLRQTDAADNLGYSRRWVQMVEAGQLPIPRAVEIACFALEHLAEEIRRARPGLTLRRERLCSGMDARLLRAL